MKTRLTSLLKSEAFNAVKVAVTAPLVAFSLPAAAQSVVIEGGPGEVQISERDGEPEPIVPGAPATAVVPAPDSEPTAAAPVIPGQPVTPEVTPQGVIVPTPPRTFGPVTESSLEVDARATVEVPTSIDVDVAKRLAEIERELNIASAATAAKVNIETNDLFVDNTQQVEPTAEPTLKKVAEYIRLRENESIAVTYHYTPVTEDEKQAWNRSVALIKWMSTKGQTNGDQYEIKNPKVAAAEETSLNAESGEGAEFTGIIELLIR